MRRDVTAPPPSRAERRRAERELAALASQPGVGRGLRLTERGRARGAGARFVTKGLSYLVREHSVPVDIEALEAESDAARARITTGVVEWDEPQHDKRG